MESSSSSAHRKIALQSPADLRYLINNVTVAAQAKLDTHFPPPDPSTTSTTTSSEARRKASIIIQAYIAQTFTHALPNLSINGLDATNTYTRTHDQQQQQLLQPTATEEEEVEEQYEAYDAALATRVQMLYGMLEAETLALAQLRREAPLRAAARWRERFEAEVRGVDEVWERERREEEEEEEEEGKTDGGLDLDALRVQREREVEETWGRGLEGLSRLKTTLPGTVAKLERAMRGVEYVEDVEGR
ncbi:MAG: hypothetical protein M1816_007232 [Peltula sp. TS41687]|nr:MAG: hypothetical protein M1816_007232 [Peltula sp. TS41687]